MSVTKIPECPDRSGENLQLNTLLDLLTIFFEECSIGRRDNMGLSKVLDRLESIIPTLDEADLMSLIIRLSELPETPEHRKRIVLLAAQAGQAKGFRMGKGEGQKEAEKAHGKSLAPVVGEFQDRTAQVTGGRIGGPVDQDFKGKRI